MITLLSIHTVVPGREEEYVAYQKKLWTLTMAEPGIIRYEHYRGTKKGQFVSLLAFTSLDAFLEHQIADYHHDARLGTLFAEHELQWLDPIPGANDLERSEIPPLAPDVGELKRQYAAMLPSSRPAWWDEAGGGAIRNDK